MKIRSKRLKRKLEPEPAPYIRKKLRSKVPRRRRYQILPVLLTSTSLDVSGDDPGCSVVSVDSSSQSYFPAEVSRNSSRASAVFATNGRSNSRKRVAGEIEGVQKNECADLYRIRTLEKQNESEVEVSESPCVDSKSGFREDRCWILKLRSGKEIKKSKETEVSEACTRSEITSEQQFSGKYSKSGAGNFKVSSEINENDVVSVGSGVQEALEKIGGETIRGKKNRASEFEFSQVYRNRPADANCADLIAQSTINQWSHNSGVDSDLACTEQFSYDDVSKYSCSQETAFSDFHSEIFPECSELEISDYTPSLFTDSGSQFSQGSVGETPSPTYSLFLQYRKEFSRLTSPDTGIFASCVEDDISYQLEFESFEDELDEDSYQMLRKRERRRVFMFNYAETYSSALEYGELVLQQRSQIVHWIVEQSCRKQLRQETMFLGVSLLDRFLSKGYFKAKRNLQIVGIACLTLATRIEENQPYNRVGQKNFNMGSSVYSRCEVVAMEWMVHEVLNFQYFLPTVYNFLWFYLKATKADAHVEKRVKYLAVLALSAHEQLCYWPSTVAAAIVILACLEANQNASHKVIGIHVRSKDENLHECIESLEWLLRYL